MENYSREIRGAHLSTCRAKRLKSAYKCPLPVTGSSVESQRMELGIYWLSTLALQLFKDTLLLIPCSAAKRYGSKPNDAVSILSTLNPACAAALSNARAALREKANVDEKTLMPAHLRYSGELYQHASASIGRAVVAGLRVLIISGGYGLLLADEPIGIYQKPLVLGDWPTGLLEECILDYARHEGVCSVIAIVSGTTNYAKLVRHVDWRGAGLAARLLSPVIQGGGAMVKVPRAQGQAVTALIDAGLPEMWQSSDSLCLSVCEL